VRRVRRRFGSIRAALLAAGPLAVAVTLAGCTRGEPPTWDGGSLSIAPLPSLAALLPKLRDASVDAPAEATAPVDPTTLPQTRDRPREGDAFQARARVLWDAIVRDEPEIALPFFFPLGAYQQVKDVANPEADWKRRLVASYRRDIHRLHESLGAHPSDAKLVELEVATERAHWVEPGGEGNKLGYWRVYGSKLRYENARGPASMDVKSLISWRGEWYVVHLSGFH